MEYYNYNLFGIKCYLTVGVHEWAEENGAYWFLNLILSYQINKDMRKETWQSWKLKRKEGDSFVATCDDGNGNILIKQEIEFSDFKGNNAVLWFIDDVLLLPSEY